MTGVFHGVQRFPLLRECRTVPLGTLTYLPHDKLSLEVFSYDDYYYYY